MINVLLEDFAKIAEDKELMSKFANSTFFVTGATGLIGSLVIKTLLYCSKVDNLNIKVIALIRSMEKAKQVFGAEYSALEYIVADLGSDNLEVSMDLDYIIHAAAITTSKLMVSNPVETIKTAIFGTQSVLDLAVRKKVKSVVYLSSMEVYGQPICKNEKVGEDDLGCFDILNPRSSYPEGKRLCECMCAAYASQYGVSVKIARLAQTFGPGILKSENRVFAQFAKSVLKGENIVLHTEGKSEGNYVYSRDAVHAILILLLKGKSSQAYNITNEASHTTIREMAEMVAKKFGKRRINVVIEIPEKFVNNGYAPAVKLFLDSKKMRSLGWKPEVDLEGAYERLVRWMCQEGEWF